MKTCSDKGLDLKYYRIFNVLARTEQNFRVKYVYTQSHYVILQLLLHKKNILSFYMQIAAILI
jgi:hypothetical protein